MSHAEGLNSGDSKLMYGIQVAGDDPPSSLAPRGIRAKEEEKWPKTHTGAVPSRTAEALGHPGIHPLIAPQVRGLKTGGNVAQGQRGGEKILRSGRPELVLAVPPAERRGRRPNPQSRPSFRVLSHAGSRPNLVTHACVRTVSQQRLVWLHVSGTQAFNHDRSAKAV